MRKKVKKKTSPKKWVTIGNQTFIEVDKDKDPDVAKAEFLESLIASNNSEHLTKDKRDEQVRQQKEV